MTVRDTVVRVRGVRKRCARHADTRDRESAAAPCIASSKALPYKALKQAITNGKDALSGVHWMIGKQAAASPARPC